MSLKVEKGDLFIAYPEARPADRVFIEVTRVAKSTLIRRRGPVVIRCDNSILLRHADCRCEMGQDHKGNHVGFIDSMRLEWRFDLIPEVDMLAVALGNDDGSGGTDD